jgi:hypothetical protein
MTKFIVEFNCDNATFTDNPRRIVVADVLHEVARNVEGGRTAFKVIDENGNTIGTAKFIREGK